MRTFENILENKIERLDKWLEILSKGQPLPPKEKAALLEYLRVQRNIHQCHLVAYSS